MDIKFLLRVYSLVFLFKGLQFCNNTDGVVNMFVCQNQRCEGSSVSISSSTVSSLDTLTCVCNIRLHGIESALIRYSSPRFPNCGIHYDIGTWRFSCQDAVIRLETQMTTLMFYKTVEKDTLDSSFQILIDQVSTHGTVAVECYPPLPTTRKPIPTTTTSTSTSLSIFTSSPSVTLSGAVTRTSTPTIVSKLASSSTLPSTLSTTIQSDTLQTSQETTVLSETTAISISTLISSRSTKIKTSTNSASSQTSLSSILKTTSSGSTLSGTSTARHSVSKETIKSSTARNPTSPFTPKSTSDSLTHSSSAHTSTGRSESSSPLSGSPQSTSLPTRNSSIHPSTRVAVSTKLPNTTQGVTTDIMPVSTHGGTVINMTGPPSDPSLYSNNISWKVLMFSIAGGVIGLVVLTVVIVVIFYIRRRQTAEAAQSSPQGSYIDAFNDTMDNSPTIAKVFEASGLGAEEDVIQSTTPDEHFPTDIKADWTDPTRRTYNWDELVDSEDGLACFQISEDEGQILHESVPHFQAPNSSDVYAIVTRKSPSLAFERRKSSFASFKGD